MRATAVIVMGVSDCGKSPPFLHTPGLPASAPLATP